MNSIIEADDLSFAYETMPVISHASFKINENEFIGIIGPNGGGKTTLLKLILRFVFPTKGKITKYMEI